MKWIQEVLENDDLGSTRAETEMCVAGLDRECPGCPFHILLDNLPGNNVLFFIIFVYFEIKKVPWIVIIKSCFGREDTKEFFM